MITNVVEVEAMDADWYKDTLQSKPLDCEIEVASWNH